MAKRNQPFFELIKEGIAKLRVDKEVEKEDSLVVIAIYRGKKRFKKSQAEVYINGYEGLELDVLLRDVYASVYALRRRDDPKMIELDKYLTDKKEGRV